MKKLLLMLSFSLPASGVIKVNDEISVINVFNQSIDVSKESLIAKTAWVKEQDMLVLVIATSGGVNRDVPKDFDEIIDIKKSKELSLSISVKLWNVGDPTEYKIKRESSVLHVSLLTLRGPILIVDAFADMNTAKGIRGLAYAPRVQGIRGGAVVSAFAYSEPHKVRVRQNKTLASLKGMAVGIGNQRFDYKTKKVMAYSKRSIRGKGYDLTLALSIY